MHEKETKKDGRQSNGCKPGENRAQGAKPRSNDGRKRVRWSHHFDPVQFEMIRATGKPIAKVVEDALTLWFSQEQNEIEI